MDVTMIVSPDEFLTCREDWEGIRSANGEENLYYSFDWYEALGRYAKVPYRSLFVLRIRDHGRTVAILPCWIVGKRLRFWTHNSLEFIGNIYSAYRGGMVLRGRETEVAGAAVDFMLSRGKLWDIAYLEFMPSRDPLLSALERSFEERRVIHRKVGQFVNMVADIHPGQTAEDYWKSRKQKFRKDMRRHVNRLNRDGQARILVTCRPGQNVSEALAHYDDIYRRSWKEAEQDPLFLHRLADDLLAKGKLRLFTLYFRPGEAEPAEERSLSVEEGDPARCAAEGFIPVATSFCAVNGAYACGMKTAYRQDYAKFSPGTVLTWHVIQWLLERDKVSLIDFQKAAEAYKYSLGRFRDVHMLLKAASPRSPIAMLETLGERILIPLFRRIGWLETPDYLRPMAPDACED